MTGNRLGTEIARGRPYKAPRSLKLTTRPFQHLTHYLFRYPAKFHPPVVRALLEQYTSRGQTVLDPFCGSGTLLVEALASGRNAVGLDVDPVAVAVASVKTHRYEPSRLRESAVVVLERASSHMRPAAEYRRRMFQDLSTPTYERQLRRVRHLVPAIPNLHHWFRKYVVVDLARIRQSILTALIPTTHRKFLEVVFASIVRNSSNADPVPVSGLEVTSHMRRLDLNGRLINPFAMFAKATAKAVDAAETLYRSTSPRVSARVSRGNAIELERHLSGTIDAVITSPPYHGAVDYYRRHQLEMFWLDHTRDQQDRLKLLDAYIGRPKVPRRDPLLNEATIKTTLATHWESRIRRVSPQRANAFRHYIVAMTLVFAQLSRILRPNCPVVFVVGHSTWNSVEIPTTELFQEVAGQPFRLDEILSYPVKNRYMSYARHNGADISTEYVLVLRRVGLAASLNHHRHREA